MTVERAVLVDYWPLVDVGKLELKAGDVVVFRSNWLVENGNHRRIFFERWEQAFPGIKCVAIVSTNEPDFVIRRAMPEMRAEDLYQPVRKTTMEA